MGTPAKSVAYATTHKKWRAMNGVQKMVFAGKVCLMVCTFGFICGGVLVEGMKYES
jgi:hypothetical protein